MKRIKRKDISEIYFKHKLFLKKMMKKMMKKKTKTNLQI